jgi:hypothetical protein
MRLSSFGILLTSISLCAAEVAPEIAPLAAKFKAETEAAELGRKAPAADLVRNYQGALDAAEKTATAAGNVKLLAALSAEREDLQRGKLKATAELPKSLLVSRKAYLTGVMKLDDEIATRKQRAVADYVRGLAALQARSGGKADLLAQIAAEKERAVRGAPIAISSAAKQLDGTTWKHSDNRIFRLSADGTIKASWGLQGTWRLLSPTRFEIQWKGNAPEEWSIDLGAGELKSAGASKGYKRQ